MAVLGNESIFVTSRVTPLTNVPSTFNPSGSNISPTSYSVFSGRAVTFILFSALPKAIKCAESFLK